MQRSLYFIVCLLFFVTSISAATQVTSNIPVAYGINSTLFGDTTTSNTSLVNTILRNRVDCGPVVCSGPSSFVKAEFRSMILKPAVSNLEYGLYTCPIVIDGSTTISNNYTLAELKTKYDFGFDVGFRFMMPACTDIGFNYERFSSTSKAFSGDVTNSIGGTCAFFPLYQTCPCAGTLYGSGTAQVKFNFNTLHFNAGQNVRYGDYLQVHFFAGVNFTKIEEIITTNFINTDTDTGPDNRVLTNPIEFKGAGPEFGFDFDYTAFYGAKIAGRVSGAVLAGKAINSTRIASTSPRNVVIGLPNPNIQHFFENTRTQFVPEIQARIGGGTGFTMFNVGSYFEVGYEGRVYFNALQTIKVATIPGSTGPDPDPNLAATITPQSVAKNVSYFGLGGVYFTLSSAF